MQVTAATMPFLQLVPVHAAACLAIDVSWAKPHWASCSHSLSLLQAATLSAKPSCSCLLLCHLPALCLRLHVFDNELPTPLQVPKSTVSCCAGGSGAAAAAAAAVTASKNAASAAAAAASAGQCGAAAAAAAAAGNAAAAAAAAASGNSAAAAAAASAAGPNAAAAAAAAAASSSGCGSGENSAAAAAAAAAGANAASAAAAVAVAAATGEQTLPYTHRQCCIHGQRFQQSVMPVPAEMHKWNMLSIASVVYVLTRHLTL